MNRKRTEPGVNGWLFDAATNQNGDHGSLIVAATPDDLRQFVRPVDQWPDDGIAVHDPPRTRQAALS